MKSLFCTKILNTLIQIWPKSPLQLANFEKNQKILLKIFHFSQISYLGGTVFIIVTFGLGVLCAQC